MTATAEPVELPVHLTRFVGRESELSSLETLLRSTRLLTLTGAGGSGKTRLASELAGRAATTFQRLAWVDLAPLSDAALLGRQTAAALHVPELGDRPAIDAIVAEVGSGAVLLVLDNCEHLVEACASFAETLLRCCPRLAIVATSREALGIPSETSWLVPPLASAEAVQLFVERAQGASASFRMTDANASAVLEICRRLDGMPLAIELAAARVRVLSVEQIAERLHDAFRLLSSGSRTALPRHRTLRGVIEWSYSLLTPLERQLLARLSVFHGSFSLEAAEDVCAAEPLVGEDILDGIAALVEKSLVVMDAGDGVARYHLLETVRQYGVERLVEEGNEAMMRERHARWFLHLAERTLPRIIGGEHEFGLTARMKADNDNLRAACAWSLADPSRAQEALRFAGALFWYWYSAGLFHDGRSFIDAAVPLADGSDPLVHGAAWQSKGLISLAQGRYVESRDAFTRAVELQRLAGDAPNHAISTAKLGAAHLMLGDIESADRVLTEAARLCEGHSHIVVTFAYFWRGWSKLMLGQFAEARAQFSRNKSLGSVSDHHTSVAHSTTMLGYVAAAEQKYDEAISRFHDALTKHWKLGDAWGLALDIDGLAMVAILTGDAARGVTLLAAVDAMRTRIGMAMPVMAVEQHKAIVGAARLALGAEYDTWHAEGVSRSFNELVRETLEGTPVRRPTPVASHAAVTTAMEPEAALDASSAEPAVAAGLEVDALGPLRVTVDGRAIDATMWGSARSRELLVFLLMHPDGVTKEKVGLAMWPDSSSSQLRNNFHVTLHRLRKTIGHAEWVVADGEHYSIDPSVVRRFDAALFEASVVAARRALKRKEPGAVAALEQALSLYRADFLDGEPAGDWCFDVRDRLQQLCIEGLLALGAAQVAEERFARAVETYRVVLSRDELHEEALRALMLAQAAAGDRTPALRAYQRFAERLKRELEAEPSKETRAVFERLTAS